MRVKVAQRRRCWLYWCVINTVVYGRWCEATVRWSIVWLYTYPIHTGDGRYTYCAGGVCVHVVAPRHACLRWLVSGQLSDQWSSERSRGRPARRLQRCHMLIGLRTLLKLDSTQLNATLSRLASKCDGFNCNRRLKHDASGQCCITTIPRTLL